MRLLLVAVSFLAVFVPTNAFKILVYSPTHGKGHMFFMGRVADILVQGGHEVVGFRVFLGTRHLWHAVVSGLRVKSKTLIQNTFLFNIVVEISLIRSALKVRSKRSVASFEYFRETLKSSEYPSSVIEMKHPSAILACLPTDLPRPVRERDKHKVGESRQESARLPRSARRHGLHEQCLGWHGQWSTAICSCEFLA